MIRRREFIAGLGSAAAWPVVARAQQSGPMRRIGALMSYPANDPEQLARIAAFVQGLQESGWTVGRNVQIDYRFVADEVERYRTYAADLVALAPDILFAADAPASRRCSRPPALCLSCLERSPIRSVPATLRASRGRAATPQASPEMNIV
jgi:hypothetical protein